MPQSTPVESHKCVVPGCKNRSGPGSSTLFFPVPAKNNKVYNKWCVFMDLGGERKEKICKTHFRNSDIITYTRRKVKDTAVPSRHLPAAPPYVKQDGYCCISTCQRKVLKTLLPFPPRKNVRPHQQWKQALKISISESIAGMRICPKHFQSADFVTVKSFYLKPHAVPSLQVKRIVKCPRRRIRDETVASGHLAEHSYYENCFKPRSNRICSVVGCKLRAGNNVHLHIFPKDKDRLKEWKRVLRSGKQPSSNARVCSKHFTKTDFIAGSIRLKKTAIPSKNLPQVPELDISVNEYITPRKSYRKTRFPLKPEDDETSFISSGLSSNGAVASIDELSSSLNQTKISDVTDCSPTETADTDANNNEIRQCELEKTADTDAKMDENNNEFIQCPTCMQQTSVNTQLMTVDTPNRKRDTILSDMLLTNDALNTWTGIPTMELLEEICLAVKKLEDVYPRKFAMNCTDRVILVFVKLKQNLSFAAIGTLFRIHAATVANYFSHTVQILSNVLQIFVYMPPKEEIRKNIPLCFRKFPNVTIILDCTEVPVGTLNCLNCRISTYSQYKGRRTTKFMIGVTPAGTISYRSKAYSGKASDKYIFNAEKLIDQLHPHLDEVMVDKGFMIENELSAKGIKLHRPPFMKGNRLSPSEAYLNETIAKARVHVERIMQRIKIFAIFEDTLGVYMLGYIDEMMSIVCGIVNLTKPILSDDKF